MSIPKVETKAMDKLRKDIELLDKCIAHWQLTEKGPDWNMLAGPAEGDCWRPAVWNHNPDGMPTQTNCALCGEYYYKQRTSVACEGCPLYGIHPGCRDTSYEDVIESLKILDILEFKSACSDMLKKLRVTRDSLIRLTKEEADTRPKLNEAPEIAVRNLWLYLRY